MKGRSGSILPATVPRRGLLLATLFAAQVGGSTGHSIGMAVGGIMAARRSADGGSLSHDAARPQSQ
jgi:hypothetical protein